MFIKNLIKNILIIILNLFIQIINLFRYKKKSQNNIGNYYSNEKKPNGYKSINSSSIKIF